MISVEMGGVFLKMTDSSLPCCSLLRGSSVFQGQFSYLEPSQDDGRVATVLGHSGQGKGLYPLQRCAGSKHIPGLEKGMVGGSVMRLRPVLACPPGNLAYIFLQALVVSCPLCLFSAWVPVGDRPSSETLLSISPCLHRPEQDC